MMIVAMDFVPIEPYERDYIDVAIGQRYDVLIEAKPPKHFYGEKPKFKSPNFWIKMRSCSETCIGDPCHTFDKDGTPLCKWKECRQGVVSYNLTSSETPDKNWRAPPTGPSKCSDPNLQMLKPWVRRDLRGHIAPNLQFKSPFLVENRKGSQVTPPPDNNSTDVNLWNIKYNDGEYSFMIDWARPTFKLVHEDLPLDPRYVPIEIEGQDSEWTVFAIVSNWHSDDPSDSDGGKPQHAISPAAHPIHLHGHDFVILAQVANATARNATFKMDNMVSVNLFNPPRRDVVMLPADGYVIIAFRVDNPGVWLMHCHIAWHASAGLALEWIERRNDIPKLLKIEDPTKGVLGQMDKQCEDWKRYYQKSKQKQDDSGI